MSQVLTIALFQQIGWPEIAIALVVALLLFGRRLPEVGKYLGRSLVEFKKGVKGFKDEFEDVSTSIDDQVDKAIEEDKAKKQNAIEEQKEETIAQEETKQEVAN